MDLRQFLSSTSINPKKILKAVISLSVIMLVIWLFMVSRMEFTGPGNNVDPAQIERADSIRTAISSNRPDREIARTESESNIFMNAVTTFVVLILILGVVWFLTRKQASGGSHKNESEFRELGEHLIGSGAQIKVLEVNGEIWVLGVTSTSVNLLHRYDKDDWKDRELEISDKVDGNFLNYFKSKL